MRMSDFMAIYGGKSIIVICRFMWSSIEGRPYHYHGSTITQYSKKG